jgi:peroxiredoxin
MEIPDLNELYSSYRKEDVVFIALATNEKKQLKSFLKKTAFNYRIIPNSQATAALYNIKGFPTSVIIDQQGIIQYVSMGIGPNNKERLAEEINKLLMR